ncbi:MAG: hypothetical protein KatS3mg101_0342 [Patescibacteria group bacterium]|nr:MAG: hypothetical protein KatS3mg101_0342 [Patescibacteria group bacterium]
MEEIAIIAAICLLSYFLILRDFDFAVYVMLLLSIFLHKELFSFYRWDLLPIRAFMLALLAAAVTKIIYWFFQEPRSQDCFKVCSGSNCDLNNFVMDCKADISG